MTTPIQRIRSMVVASVFVAGCSKHQDDTENKPPPGGQTTEQQQKDKEQQKEKDKQKEEQQAKEKNGNKDKTAENGTPADQQRQNPPQQGTPSGGQVIPPVTTAPAPRADNQPEQKPEQKSQSRADINPQENPVPQTQVQPPAPNSVAGIIDAKDKTTLLFTHYLAVADPVQADEEGNRIVKEILSEDTETPDKMLELQVAIGKLARSDHFTPEVKEHIALLQGKLDEKKKSEGASGLGPGIYLVSAGLGLVGGTLAGTGFYDAIPGMVRGSVNGVSRATKASVEGIGNGSVYVYDKARLALHKESWTSAKDWVVEGGASLANKSKSGIVNKSAAFGNAVTGLVEQVQAPAETLLRNNLENVGLTITQRNLLTHIREIDAADIPPGLQYLRTPKSTLSFAVLDRTPGNENIPLGINRIFVFKQARLIRGRLFETTFVTDPLHAQAAGIMAARMRARATDPSSSRLVQFFNLRTGTLSPSRWSAPDFKAMLTAAGVRVRPLLGYIDVPTVVGSGLFTTAAVTAVYWYGFKNGHDYAEEPDLDLQSLVGQPQAQLDSQ